MRLKDSSQTRMLGLILSAMGGINLVLGIIYLITAEANGMQRFLTMLVSSILWGACGAIVLSSSKKQRIEEEEQKKKKTTAFNYGKKKK